MKRMGTNRFMRIKYKQCHVFEMNYKNKRVRCIQKL